MHRERGSGDNMSYESPINIIYGEINSKLENEVLTAIQNIGIDVNKEELIRALQYDREQYQKGYENGFNDAMLGKQELMYEGEDGKWYKKDW